jgi:hypothetical protein
MPNDKSPQRSGKPARADQRPSAKVNRTEARQAARQAEQRRQRLIVTAVAVVAVVIVGALVLFASNTPAEAPIPETASRYDGLVQVMTDKGYARIGDIEAINVSVYTGFACDACRSFYRDVVPPLIERVRAGEISLTFVPLRGGNIANPNGAARSAICAGQQGEFFQYADALYYWLDQYEGDAFRDNRLTTGAANLGLDQGQFGECRRSAPENETYSSAQADLAGDAGATTPPLVRVNNTTVDSLELAAIDAAIDSAIDFRSGTTTDEPGEGVPTEEPAESADDSTPEVPAASPTVEPTEQPTAEPTAADGE